jgi:Family of unknown function (DUF5675)
MKQVILNRLSDNGTQTLGSLSFVQDNGQVFVCKTLELSWKNNQHDTSCVPEGTYTCSYTRSEKFSAKEGHDVFTYEVLNVPARGGIRIHSANFFSDLLGCVALGGALHDINGDGQQDITDSGNTINAFVNELHKEDFMLLIHAVPLA